MTDRDAMLAAFREAYHDVDHWGGDDEADDWYCEKLGDWAMAWKAATAAERETCAVLIDNKIVYLRKLMEATAPYVGTAVLQTAIEVCESLAAAIRAKGESSGEE